MPKSIHRTSRKFLNPAKSYDTGILEWKVEQYDEGIDATFSIWDCYKKIVLDFNLHDELTAKQRAKKLQILIDELISFREAIADALSNSVLTYEDKDDS